MEEIKNIVAFSHKTPVTIEAENFEPSIRILIEIDFRGVTLPEGLTERDWSQKLRSSYGEIPSTLTKFMAIATEAKCKKNDTASYCMENILEKFFEALEQTLTFVISTIRVHQRECDELRGASKKPKKRLK
jgi:hypothetical protein